MYTKKEIERIKEELAPVKEATLYETFNDDIDENLTCEIGQYQYSASEALRKLDRCAYDAEFSNWLDSMIGDYLTDEIDGEYYKLDEVEDLLNNIEEEDNDDE
jgi:hypothetical protein